MAYLSFAEILKTYQPYILISCGLASILLAVFARLIEFQSIRKQRALFGIEMGMAALMISDGLAYIFRGDTSLLGIGMVRTANFLVFCFTILNLYFLCDYITALFMEQGKFEKLPLRLLLGHIIPWVGVSLIVVSQFTGMYYYYDENNLYHRGPLFALSAVITLGVLVMLFSFVVQYRSMINKGLHTSLVIFSILPMVASFAQFFLYGYSLINFASWLAGVILFAFALIDQNQVLSKAASTEMATGLPNTYGYLYEVERVIHHKDITEYNGYYFDIVRMSQMNNKYGKALGDEIILKYATYIRAKLDRDEILGRLGGNFFVALVKKSNTDKFLKLLSDVPVKIKFRGQEEELHIAAVAGGYEINKKNIAAGQILGNSAAAVTYAKNEVHRPYVFMDEALEKKFKRIRETEEATRKALTTDEFEPFYQPKVNIDTRELCGAEALARWRHEGSLVAPYQFIPIMEKNGSICELDFYILEQVCRDLRNWLDRGLEPPCISVNFSRRHLGNPNLAGSISEVVEKYRIPKDLIQIEITETIDEYPMSYLQGLVEGLHSLGLKVAIDDFGTGSSSINLLKQVSFDVMKIDKAFVEYEDEKQKKLLAFIIQMAETIGIATICEGVEEEDQLSLLQEMGCHEVQGYVFDRPLERADFEERIQRKTY